MNLKLPQLGEGADSGTVVNILVKEGDCIEKDQTIIELENEKAVAPIPATAAGTVTKLHVQEGDQISVGQVILSLADSDAAGGDREPRKEEKHEDDEEPQPEAAEEPSGEQAVPEELKPEAVAASPTIRKFASQLGIDLRRVRGSERGGRIVMKDLKAYIQRLQKLAETGRPPTRAESSAEKIEFAKWGPVSRKPMSGLRKAVSRKMTGAWTTVPHVTQFDEADITDLLAVKKRHDEAYKKAGARLTLTPLLLKAVLPVLIRQPLFNASIDPASEEIVFKEYFHIGIAVDTEAGLMVPVIRDCDSKSVLDLAREIEELAAKARERKLAADEMKGSTFTISNQGGFGGGHFTPIINAPEVAILGVGRGVWRPVIRDERIEPRVILPLCLSYDHRLIDGAGAARFVAEISHALQDFPEAEINDE